MAQRKKHVIEKRWSTGGFYVTRHVKCRCGWTAKHYNAGYLTEEFKQHRLVAEAADSFCREGQPLDSPSDIG